MHILLRNNSTHIPESYKEKTYYCKTFNGRHARISNNHNNIIIRGQGQPSDETTLGYEDQDQGQPRVENNTIKTESAEYIKAPFQHQRQTCPAIRLSPSELRLDIVSARIYNLYFCIYVCVY
jgi:hypothetical protein